VSGGDVATLAASRRDFARSAPGHPVLWDGGNRNHRNYGVTDWPTAFLIGSDGKVFWQGNPHRLRHRADEHGEFLRLLTEQLDRAHPADDGP